MDIGTIIIYLGNNSLKKEQEPYLVTISVVTTTPYSTNPKSSQNTVHMSIKGAVFPRTIGKVSWFLPRQHLHTYKPKKRKKIMISNADKQTK